MLFNKQIILLGLFFFVINKVNSSCKPSTTQLTTILNLFNHFNMQTRQTRATQRAFPITTTTLTTTTIPYGNCKNVSYISPYRYGSDYQFNGLNGALVPYRIKLSDIKEMIIYSNKDDINAFEVTYINGSVLNIGNTSNPAITNATLVNFEGKDLVEISIRAWDRIIGIQFLIHDLLDDTYSWTSSINTNKKIHQNHRDSIVNAETFAGKKASNFKITELYGFADNTFIKILRADLMWKICNPYETEPSFPELPVLTTTTLTTTTTTIPFGTCLELPGISATFGARDLTPYSDGKQFNYSIADLSNITISHNNEGYGYGITFFTKNGNVTQIGNVGEENSFNVDLEDKIITSVTMLAGDTVHELQFLVYDRFTDQYSLTHAFNQFKANDYVNAKNNEPLSSNFYITWISGTGASYMGISKLQFGYRYRQCNPAVPATIPPTKLY